MDSLFKKNFGDLADNAVLSDIADVTMGQSPVGISYNEEGVGTVFYQGRAEFGWRYPSQKLRTTEPKRMAMKNDVLMSVRAPVGDLNLAYEDCCIGRGLAAIHCEYPAFCFYLMRSLRKKLDTFNKEGTVFGSINSKALKGMPIALPDRQTIKTFEKKSASIDSYIRDNETESRALAALRETLLPKLMSGEIDVSKIDLTQLNSHLSISMCCRTVPRPNAAECLQLLKPLPPWVGFEYGLPVPLSHAELAGINPYRSCSRCGRD